VGRRNIIAKRWLGGLLAGLLLPALAVASSSAETSGEHLGQILPLWSIIPFIGILLSIAIFPLGLLGGGIRGSLLGCV
jgi:hypothetical protein